MSQRSVLQAPPAIQVHVLRDHGVSQEGFLRVRHMTLQNEYADGHRSASYAYFMVERDLLDAVVIVLYRKREDGEVEILVRSQLRPPLAFRARFDVPLLAEGTGAVQWEVPAGLVERGERGESGLFARASAEALEEAGYHIAPERFRLLGAASSLSPGLLAEKLHFVCAELALDEPCTPATGDGHAVEEVSVSVFVTLEQALAALHAGLIHDVKTEVALYRLAQLTGAR